MRTIVSMPGLQSPSSVGLIGSVCQRFPKIKGMEVDLKDKNVTLYHRDDFDVTKWIEEIQLLGEEYVVHSLS